ncbi:MAG TPA: hypothetical protein VG367_16860 [Mucilaginibacter sp.]|nr:hypothetical protein [Mucilaginibacter sp.]
MKIVAFILIFYFCALIAQPFINIGLGLGNSPNTCHPQEMCCKEKIKHQGQKEQNTTCNRDFCNPFVPCGTSIVYRMPLPDMTSPVKDVPVQLKPATNENIISNYLSDCWRPPELLS